MIDFIIWLNYQYTGKCLLKKCIKISLKGPYYSFFYVNSYNLPTLFIIFTINICMTYLPSREVEAKIFLFPFVDK